MWILIKEILKILLIILGEFIGICFLIALIERWERGNKMNEEYRLKIIDNTKEKQNLKEPLINGSIVYCRGNGGAGNFIGIVYEDGILELPYASNAYIHTKEQLYIGDTISCWTIEKVYKNAKLILE